MDKGWHWPLAFNVHIVEAIQVVLQAGTTPDFIWHAVRYLPAAVYGCSLGACVSKLRRYYSTRIGL